MIATITGTFSELMQLWELKELCELIHVDPYSVSMISERAEFVITQDDLIRVGLFIASETDN